MFRLVKLSKRNIVKGNLINKTNSLLKQHSYSREIATLNNISVTKTTGQRITSAVIYTSLGSFCFFGTIASYRYYKKQKSTKKDLDFFEEYHPDSDSENSNFPSFKDVCGNDDVKQELNDIVCYLKDPAKFKQMGARVTKGILISGNPGCGKTLLAKALAGEANVPFLQCSGTSFEQIFVGLGAKRVRRLFEHARKLSPCIIFIDEIDALGQKREGFRNNRTSLNQLLSEMDGFAEDNEIVILAATNLPQKLDSALTRSGRFDRKVRVNLPDKVSREEIFQLYLKDKPTEKLNVKNLAGETAGFSGADIYNIVNTAATEIAKKGEKLVTQNSISEAIAIIALGRIRKNLGISSNTNMTTAYHESGHTIAALFGEKPKNISQVTILPRGPTMGATYSRQSEDSQFTVTKADLLSQLDLLMGGFVAEELVNGRNHVTSGSSDDFKKATGIASEMVLTYGFNEKFGKISLGSDSLNHLPDEIQKEVNTEVKKILGDSYTRTKNIIVKKEKAFKKLAEELLKKNTLYSDEILRIVNEKE